jgi:hypothetical protein
MDFFMVEPRAQEPRRIWITHSRSLLGDTPRDATGQEDPIRVQDIGKKLQITVVPKRPTTKGPFADMNVNTRSAFHATKQLASKEKEKRKKEKKRKEKKRAG